MTAFRRHPALWALLTALCLPAAVLRADTASAPAFDNATVRPGGPRPGDFGKIYFNIEGASNGVFASFGAADFHSSDFIINGIPVAVNAVNITLTQANAAFTSNGSVNFYIVEDTMTSIQPSDQAVVFDAIDPEGLNGQLAPVHSLGSGTFTQVGDGGTQDTFPFVPDDATAAYLLAVLNNGGVFRVVITPADADVAATYAGFSNAIFTGPTLTLDVTLGN